jgi:hypothetical protein
MTKLSAVPAYNSSAIMIHSNGLLSPSFLRRKSMWKKNRMLFVQMLYKENIKIETWTNRVPLASS